MNNGHLSVVYANGSMNNPSVNKWTHVHDLNIELGSFSDPQCIKMLYLFWYPICGSPL